MQSFASKNQVTTHVLQFDQGDYLLESIRDFIRAEGIRNGTVVSGVGTLDQATLHMITTTTYPPELTFPRWGNAPLELVGMQGAIIDGEPHIHVTISTDHGAVGGHLEDKCRVFYLAEVVILAFDGFALTRTENDKGILKIVPQD